MEGRDDIRIIPEKHLPRDLPPLTPELIALQALVDKWELKQGEEQEDE